MLAAGCSKQQQPNNQNSSQQATSSISNEASSTPAGQTAGWNSYASPAEYGFAIKYPPEFGFNTDINQVRSLTYIPVCGDNTKACIFLTHDKYPGTNFDGAGVSVNLDPALNTEVKCYKFDVPTNEAQNQITDVIINAVDFKSAIGGQGAAGHFDKTQIYRNFHNGMCYEIAQTVVSSSIGNYPPGTVKQFDENAVWQKLQGVAETFEFTGGNASANPPESDSGTGGIIGIAMLGPTCPVVKNPPDPQCADKPYRVSLVVQNLDRNGIKNFMTDAEGKFKVNVPAGQYYIASTDLAAAYPRCSSGGPVIVKSGSYTNVTVSCDTGIR